MSDVMQLLDFYGSPWKLRQWTPGMPVYANHDRTVGADTETTPIVKGVKTPLVWLQVAYPSLSLVDIVSHVDVPFYLDQVNRQNPGLIWDFYNAPFDLEVLDARSNFLWGKVEKGELFDMGMRYGLHTLANGTFMGQWGLEIAAKDLLGISLPKDKTVQLSFYPGQTLTEEQLRYMACDAIATSCLRKYMPNPLPTEDIQLRGTLALHQIGLNGMRVDVEHMCALREWFDKKRDVAAQMLLPFGWLAGNTGVQNGWRAQEILKSYEKELGIKFARTEAGALQITKESMFEAFGDKDFPPFVHWLMEYNHSVKMSSTYLSDEMVCCDGKVHPYFNPMLKTGRVSCSDPNIENLPRKGGIRSIYIPDDGHVFLAIDYSQIELCALAQHCIGKYGFSVMGDIINSGVDLHYWYASKFLEKDIDVVTKDERQESKAYNFGFPGGLGIQRVIAMARSQYGVRLTEERARESKELWLKSFPEMERHLQPDKDLESPSRNLRRLLRKYGLPPNLRTPTEVISALMTRPELDKSVIDDIVSDAFDVYQATTFTGRTKRNCTFCAAANLPFQGLASDGAKLALWYLTENGFHIVNFIHDEAIIQLPIDGYLQERIRLAEKIMVDSMQVVIPDVKVKTESSLMMRWYKEAKPKRDEQGNLLFWSPEQAA